MAGRDLLSMLILAFGLAGCGAGWHRTQLAPGPLPKRQQVQVWHGGSVERWHGVVLSSDSISGIPFLRPAACDSCRFALSRTDIDSLRVGRPVLGFWKTTAMVVLTPVLIAEAVCAIRGRFPSGCWPAPD